MTNNERQLYEALNKIARLASSATATASVRNGDGEDYDGADQRHGRTELPSCTIKQLPRRLLERAADIAVRINPVNAPAVGALAAFGPSAGLDAKMRIAVMTAKYWGPTQRQLTVSFMESTPADLRRRIVSHLNAWSTRGSISFVETRDTGEVRISRSPDGYWSYVGTDVLQIPKNLPTMNLDGFTTNTSEEEYRRVVRHEAGHTLGFPHEHMRADLVARIDRQKAYDYFWRTQGWDPAMVDAQVLTALDERSIIGTPADQTSIMCYQLPGSITKDGRQILGGLDINQTDFSFVGTIYPQASLGLMRDCAEDWPESDDVHVSVS